jgi:hypothetical protein
MGCDCSALDYCPGAFYQLYRLGLGSKVYVRWGGVDYEYVVVWVCEFDMSMDFNQVYAFTDVPSLTLGTGGGGLIGGHENVPFHIVRAELGSEGEQQPCPAGGAPAGPTGPL